MKLHIESIIRQEIESVFGRRIVSSRDCIQLSNEILLKTQLQLNPNTLRRFFGLVKAEYPPSYATLDILSKYCGFQTVDDVKCIKKKEVDTAEENPEIMNFIVSLFRDAPVKNAEDQTFISLVYNTVNYLNRNAAFTDKFQIQIAKTKNGQEFYFEKFVNIDKLNSYYGDGLRYYYTEKHSPSAQVFAHALLVYRYWLTQNTDMLQKHFSLLSAQPLDDSLTPFIYGRYWAASIYKADAAGEPIEDILLKAYTYYASIVKENAAASFPRFELYLSEALVLTGHFDEGLYFIEQAKKSYSEKDDYTHWKFYQNFLLLETIALCKIRCFKEAEERFNKINPSNFYFLRKSFSNILYLHLVKQLKRYSVRYDSQFDELIQVTGFTRLQSLF